MSKSSKRRQTVNKSNDSGAADKGFAWPSRTVMIAGIVVACILIAAIWLFVSQPSSDPIVGTWTDDNNYWAYAYYSNGSILQMGWYTHRVGDNVTHYPVYLTGTWVKTSNNHYSINPENGNMTFEAVISDNVMSVLNTSSSNTHKISRIPDVNQVQFNYIP